MNYVSVIVENQDAATALADLEAEIRVMPGEDDPVLDPDLCLVVSKNPIELADALITRGMDSMKMEVVHVDLVDGGWDAIASLDIGALMALGRDVYFDDFHSLSEHQVEPEDNIRIAVEPNWATRHIRWRLNEVAIVAGPYGCGKSTLMQYLGYDWCAGDGAYYFNDDGTRSGRRREKPCWYVTWEDDPTEQSEQIERYVMGHRYGGTPSSSQSARISDLKRMVQYTDARTVSARNLDWFIARSRHANKKFGTNYFVLDPWSEFDHDMDLRQLETQYVKKMMHQLSMLAQELRAVIVVVTHIGKAKYSDDGGVRPFRVADALGSVQFGSSASRGICVQRTSNLTGTQDHMVVYFDKIKIEGEQKMGVAKELVALTFDPHSFHLSQDADATGEAATAWGCRMGGTCAGSLTTYEPNNAKAKASVNGEVVFGAYSG